MSSESQGVEPGAKVLRRELSLWQVSLSGVGVILGAGVYALVGPASGLAGNALWLAFLLAGVTASLTAYSYARLGSMRPKDSPEFQYTAMAFGPRVGFVAGWLMLAADMLAAAAVCLGFGGYLAHIIGTPLILNSLGLLVIVAVALYIGISKSVGLAIVLTFIEATGLLVIAVIGLPFWPKADFVEAPMGMGGVWGAVSLIFFAYLGFDELGNFAEEMRQPERDLPRALFVSLVVSTAIYIAVSLSAIAVVGWRDLSSSDAPLALVAGRVLGSKADMVISFMALAATANTVLLLLASAARSVYGMASAGVLPHGLGVVGARGIPVRSTAVALGIAAMLVLLGDLAKVAALTNAAVLSSFMLTNASLPWLTLRNNIEASPMRRVADLLFPGLALSVCGWLLLFTGWMSIAVAATLAVVGLALGAVTTRFTASSPD
ncbi:MAG: hypothetical protein HW403_89 [Dehalococcoidia bacterium]|nr:hypothetical protein [Dehalococcoidia bacterium]